MHKKYTILLVTLLLSIVMLLPGSALAQSGDGYDLWWHVFGNGGAEFVSGGNYQLGFTIGHGTPSGVSSGGNYQLVQGYWAGATDPALARPAAITDLAATQSGVNCQLNWTAITQDMAGHSISGVTYDVYRVLNAPYFTPDSGNRIATGLTSTTFTDPDTTVFGDPDRNAFYVVRAVNTYGQSDDSNRVGTFNFALVPGS